jgi:hypothetical protein
MNTYIKMRVEVISQLSFAIDKNMNKSCLFKNDRETLGLTVEQKNSLTCIAIGVKLGPLFNSELACLK